MIDDTTLFLLLIGNLILSLVVGWAASQRGRGSMSWFFLSLVISPILALLVLMAAGNQKKKDSNLAEYQAWKHSQSAAPAAAFSPAINGLPKPLLSKWHIARGEETLGEYSIGQIMDLYRAGALTASDLYWDTQAHEWLELAAHPRLG